jgi:hypothetical protein
VRRIIVVVMLTLVAGASTHSQQKRPRTNPGSHCGDVSALRIDDGFSEFYVRAVYDYFQPPDWNKALIRIAVRGDSELKLWTDGKRYQLWTYTTTPHNIYKYLDDLSDSCRLPGSPSDAARLIKVKWESADISSSQFAQIHQNLILALSQYVSRAQQRYSTLEGHMYLDAFVYRVGYDNAYEHLDVEVIADHKEFKPMLDWIVQLQKLAESSFHRPFRDKADE